MKNDLIERYLYAVTKRMNPRIREDVKNELAALIDDMLAERCEGEPVEKDIRVVLTELGTPQELYAKYDDSSDRSLIGPPYYGTYKLVTGIVLACVAVGMTVSSLIIHFVEAQVWYETLLSWISLLWAGCLQGFAIVTMLFAFFSRKGIQLGEPYNLDELPPVPKKMQEISRSDCIASISLCVVFMVFFLAVPQKVIGYWSDGVVIPLFDAQVMRTSWHLILIFGCMDVICSAIRLMEGRYNRRVLISTLATNAISAIAVTLWLTRSDLINPEFVTRIQALFADGPAFIQEIFIHFGVFGLAVILFALALDTVETAVKTLKK